MKRTSKLIKEIGRELGIMVSEAVKVGDFYQDCRYHPCICYKINGDEYEGISLIDGSWSNCSWKHCGLTKMSFSLAVKIKENWEEIQEYIKSL